MNKKIISILTLLLILTFSICSTSFAAESSDELYHMINSSLIGLDGYSIVDSNDKNVTSEIINKFGFSYNLNELCNYLSENDYSIKNTNDSLDNTKLLRSTIVHRIYNTTYTKILTKYYNGTTHMLTVSFQPIGELDFDSTTGVITTVYAPSLYILGFDKPASVASAQISSGTLSNSNKTVNHTIVLNCKMQVQVYGDIYEWIDMPTITQNYSYTPSSY